MRLILLLLTALPIELHDSRALLPGVDDSYAITIKRKRTTGYWYERIKDKSNMLAIVDRGDLCIHYQHYHRRPHWTEMLVEEKYCVVIWRLNLDRPFMDDTWVTPVDWQPTGKSDQRPTFGYEEP